MPNGISISRIWSDDDLVELHIVVTAQASSFSNTAYAGHEQLTELADELSIFKNHIHGGIQDFSFGKFGSEYANGAFQARLHFRSPGKLNVSTHQQSDFTSFSGREVANEARLYLVSEPVLLDNFIAELGCLVNGTREDASLECT